MAKKITRGRKRVRTLPPGLRKAVEAVGGTTSALAIKLGITPQAVAVWDKIPIAHVREIERITKVPREELRPDIYR